MMKPTAFDQHIVIENVSKKQILAKNGKGAYTFLTRLKGLLGKTIFPTDEALIIYPCNSIHMFFMKFPIDVLFVNAEHQIVEILPEFQPYRISRIYHNANYVIEMPVGTIHKTGTTKGDTLRFTQDRI